jgi:hypothetical protein
MPSTFIITLPDHDVLTKYFSAWSEKIIQVAKTKKINIIKLVREKANKKEVIGRVKKLRPDLVVINGHGNDVCVTGQDNEPLLTEGDKVFPTNIIYARSCRAAKSLGKNLVANGVSAFISYDEDFVMRINTENIQKPLENKVAELYMIPSNYVPISLLKGHEAEESNQRSIELYKKTIKELYQAGSKSEFYEEIKFLYHDMIHQVCLGNPKAKLF